MNASRTHNVARNLMVGMTAQVLSLLLSFVSRTVFIKTLGVTYLGVEGLFTNVLSLLSFAELGIGNAIIFSLYHPVATGDTEKIKSLMQLYKTAYRAIAALIAVVGISLVPFLGLIIKDTPDIRESIVLIYLLYLTNTAISYLFSYKKSVITVHQQDYIVTLYRKVFFFVQTILQIVVLYLTHNFVLFLCIQIVCTLADNLAASNKADRMYPYIKDKAVKKISPEEGRDIAKRVGAMSLYKFGSVMLNGTSNIVITVIIGIAAVGVTSNYNMLLSATGIILAQISSAYLASVGNVNAIGEPKKKEAVFNQLFMSSAWIYGFVTIGLMLFVDEFVRLWVGDAYVLQPLITLSLLVHFYVNLIQTTAYAYRITTGTFLQGMYAPVIAAVLNLVLSVWLGKTIGLAGVFFATAIARLATTTWIDPYLVYKKVFGKSCAGYFVRYFAYLAVILVNLGINYYVLKFIPAGGWLAFGLRFAVCCAVANLVFFAAFFKTAEFKGLQGKLSLFVGKYRRGV